jgi:hypothetical protein
MPLHGSSGELASRSRRAALASLAKRIEKIKKLDLTKASDV